MKCIDREAGNRPAGVQKKDSAMNKNLVTQAMKEVLRNAVVSYTYTSSPQLITTPTLCISQTPFEGKANSQETH